MASTVRAIENLLVLSSVSPAQLNRAHYISKLMSNYINNQDLGKYIKKLGDAYPKHLDKIIKDKSTEEFAKHAQEIVQKFEDVYTTYLMILDYHTQVLSIQQDIRMTYSTTRILTLEYIEPQFKVQINWCKIHLLLSTTSNLVLPILSAYTKAQQIVHSTLQIKLDSVLEYSNEYGKHPLEKLRYHIEPLSNILSNISLKLQNIQVGYLDKLLPWKNLCSVLDTSQICTISKDEVADMQNIYMYDISEWILWVYYICPQELINPEAVTLVCQQQSTANYLQLHRDICINMHDEYEKLFSDYVIKAQKFKLNKFKTQFKESIINYDKKITIRKLARQYLIYMLKHIQRYIKLDINIISPKLYYIISQQYITRREVLWYMVHRSMLLNSQRTIKNRSNTIADDITIYELLSQYLNIIKLITTDECVDIVKEYYSEYISSSIEQLNNYHDIQQSYSDLSFQQTMYRYLTAIYNIQSQDKDKIIKMKSLDILRQNIQRIMMCISTYKNAQNMNQEEIIILLSLQYNHSKGIDLYIKQIEDISMKMEQIWFKNVIINDFTNNLNLLSTPSSQSLSYILSNLTNTIQCLPYCTYEVAQTFPSEITSIGNECIYLMENLLIMICTNMNKIQNTQIDKTTQYYKVLSDKSTLKRMEAMDMSYIQQQSSNNPTIQQLSGIESIITNVQDFKEQQESILCLKQLFDIQLSNNLCIVYKYTINPIGYIIKYLKISLHTNIRKLCTQSSKQINKPSDILLSLKILLHNYIQQNNPQYNQNIDRLIQSVQQLEFTTEQNTIINPIYDTIRCGIDSTTVIQNTDTFEPCSKLLLNWYNTIQLMNQQYMQLYNDKLHLFEKKPYRDKDINNLPNIQTYTNLIELRSLVLQVGSSGIEQLNRMILKIINKDIERIYSILDNNKNIQKPLYNQYIQTQLWKVADTSQRDKDEFISQCIHLGSCLQFRKNLYQAQNDISKIIAPDITQIIETGYDVATRLVTEPLFDEQIKPIQDIMLHYGIQEDGKDITLYNSLRIYKRDIDNGMIWRQQPEMLCFSLSHYMNDNIHQNDLMNNVISSIIVSIRTQLLSFIIIGDGTTNTANHEQQVTKELERFIRIISYSQISLNFITDKMVSPYVMIFLQYFIESCEKYIPMSRLEEYVPFTILRTSYIHLNENRTSVKAAGTADE